MTDTKTQIQEAQKAPNMVNTHIKTSPPSVSYSNFRKPKTKLMKAFRGGKYTSLREEQKQELHQTSIHKAHKQEENGGR